LQLWTQIVGKVRLAKAPMMNHWWQVPLYVTSRGLTTSPIPHESGRCFQIDFDFIDHRLLIEVDDGRTDSLPLTSRPVADFYRELMDRLQALGLDVRIWTMPVEIPNAIPFEHDREHAAYDPHCAHQFWRALVEVDRVLKQFRSGFLGKASPVHFFWGGFDMAVTRFSGRLAPPHPSAPDLADRVTREAYSHEVSSCGFWPGDRRFKEAAFYAYSAPSPAGLDAEPVRPAAAHWDRQLGEFILKYSDARIASAPDQAILDFCESAYEAGAKLAEWDRPHLERATV
jgi:hypothetical protein